MAYNVNHFDISTPQELDAVIKQSKGRTVIRFYRTDCPACESSTGTWLDFVRRPENRAINFVSIETSSNRPLAAAFNITRVPTFVATEPKRTACTLIGADPEALRRLIETGSDK